MNPARLPRLAALALALLGAARGTAADDAEAPPALVSGEVTADERAVVVEASSCCVRLALSAEGTPPPDGASDVFGVQLDDEGLVLTTRTWLVTAANDRARRVLWLRRSGLAWERAVPVARTAFGDLGIVRTLRPRKAGLAPPFSESNRVERAFLVRRLPDGRALVDVPHRLTTAWTDPALGGDRVDTTRAALGASPGPKAVSFRVAWESARGSDAVGAPLVDARGALVGLVIEATATRTSSGASVATLVSTPTEFLRLFVRAVAAEGAFRPPDLGVRFAPSAKELETGNVPKDLLDVRAAGKFRGGALVADVAPGGPASEILWAGDVVLEIGGRPVSSTVPESFLPALAALASGERAALTLWRGGKKETIYVTPRPGESEAR